MPGNENSGPRRYDIAMPGRGSVVVYSNVAMGRALDHITQDMSFYDGVKLSQVLEAVYQQGVNDGSGAPRPGRPRLDQ